MDILTLALIALLVVALVGWGYGSHGYQSITTGDAIAAPSGWVSPVVVLALLAVIGLVLMLGTGWRALGPVF